MSIRRITRQEVIDSVPERWREQYPDSRHGADKLEIARRLNELEVFGTPLNSDEVNRIIGNNTWTTFNCDICDRTGLVGLTGFPDPHSEIEDGKYIKVCDACIGEAVRLSRKVE